MLFRVVVTYVMCCAVLLCSFAIHACIVLCVFSSPTRCDMLCSVVRSAAVILGYF